MDKATASKALPQLPPKSNEVAVKGSSEKTTVERKLSDKKSESGDKASSQNQITDSNSEIQEDAKRATSNPGPPARASTIDRIISKIDEISEEGLRKDVDQALPILERMDVQARTQMVVCIYNKLEKIKRSWLESKPRSIAILKEYSAWERAVEQRLRML